MGNVVRFNKAIGSTDISGIVGTSPFAGPWEVYNRITKPQEDRETGHLKMGHDLEPFLLEAVKRIDPRWLVRLGLPEAAATTFAVKPGKSVHSTAGRAPTRSTPDGRIVKTARHQKAVISIEAKTAWYADRTQWARPLGDYDEWELSGDALLASAVPASYYDQAQWHMYHEGTSVCLLPVAFNYTTSVKTYVVVRDASRIGTLVAAADEFWCNYIIGGATPPPDASDGMKAHMAAAEAENEEYAPAEDIHEEYLDGLDRAKAAAAEAEKEKKKYQNLLRAAIVESGGAGLYFDSPTRKGRISYKLNKKGAKTLSVVGAKRL